MGNAANDVLAIEKRFWTEADSPRIFEEHMADGAITVIDPMGVIEKRQAVAMTADEPWQDVQMTDVTVREVAPDCVVVAYHGQGRQAGREEPHRSSVASTYLKRDGDWQLVLTAHQPWAPDR